MGEGEEKGGEKEKLTATLLFSPPCRVVIQYTLNMPLQTQQQRRVVEAPEEDLAEGEGESLPA